MCKGIIFIPTNFVDYDLGIEWRSINAFLFEHGRITKCIIKKVWDSMEDQVVYDDIFSIDEMNGMRKVLEKAEFKVLVLVGDVYQIESIYFGNWFEIARNFISSESVFELIHPYRTQNKNKMSSGEKLPLCFYK